jgi:hypothetical protein
LVGLQNIQSDLDHQLRYLDRRIPELERIVIKCQNDIDTWAPKVDQYAEVALKILDELASSSSADNRAALEAERVELDRQISDLGNAAKNREKYDDLVAKRDAVLVKIRDAQTTATDGLASTLAPDVQTMEVHRSVADALNKYLYGSLDGNTTAADTMEFLSRLNVGLAKLNTPSQSKTG